MDGLAPPPISSSSSILLPAVYFTGDFFPPLFSSFFRWESRSGAEELEESPPFFWNGGIRPDISFRFSGGCDDCKIPIAKVFLLFLFFYFPIGDFCTFSPVRLRPSVSLPHRYTRKKGGCYPWPNEAAQKEGKRKREEEVAMMGAPLLPLPPKGVHKAPLDSTSTSGSSFSLS